MIRAGAFGGALVMLGVAAGGACAQAVPDRTEALGGFLFEDSTRSQFRLPRLLQEISGLAVSDSGRLFGHNDEQAIIFELNASDGSIAKAWGLGQPMVRGDFEGMATAGDRFYLVSSTGVIIESVEGENDSRVEYNRYGTGLGRSCEVEGLAFEPADTTLLVLCKNPVDRTLRNSVSIFKWSLPDRRITEDSPLQIPFDDFELLADIDDLKPSGIDRDPVTGNYVIVAARPGLVAEITPAGELVSVIDLSERWHGQAEGIAIGPQGQLIIADEGRNRRGRLTVYSRTEPAAIEQ